MRPHATSSQPCSFAMSTAARRASPTRLGSAERSPRLPLGELPEINWVDLVAYPFISLQGQFTERLMIDLRAGAGELNFAPTTEVAFMSTALAMVSAGLGVTVCLPYAEPLVRLHRGAGRTRPCRRPMSGSGR
mgnify:CR=1 FL=1